MDEKKFRLYIDESGTHDYSTIDDIKNRYLGLTGIIISEKENIEVLQPKLLEMKRLVANDIDELPILHREEIINKTGDFAKLNDPEVEKKFNDILFDLLDNMDFTLCAVVLDKKSHHERYQKSAFHPYHYCMNVLIERYVFCLEEKGGRGDVVAEARGKKEDCALKTEYQRFYENGTYFCKNSYVQNFLTSKEIKIKPKSKMFVGLEFADLLSLATKLDILQSYNEIPTLTENFCKEIVKKIQKNYRHPTGKSINGYGRKLIR
ncbi:MAG: hypothetical protein NTY12_05305 [Candidatus Falkowbacteria bacterium]|nr:hypothetical protein [Candidatus Falkowbacteria bacterium]